MSETYTFTTEQLWRLLTETIDLFQEFRDVHGHNGDTSKTLAVAEAIDGLDAEIELYHAGEIKRPSQVIVD